MCFFSIFIKRDYSISNQLGILFPKLGSLLAHAFLHLRNNKTHLLYLPELNRISLNGRATLRHRLSVTS